MIRTLLVVAMVISVPAFAQPKGKGGRGRGNPACAPIRNACEKAGFTMSKKGGPGTVKECVQQWASGKQVKGITIRLNDPSVKDCLARVNSQAKAPGAPARPAPAVQPGNAGSIPPAGTTQPRAVLPRTAPKAMPTTTPPPAKKP